MLAWARETAGLSLSDAAARIGLKSAARRSSVEKLEALEIGEAKPTRKQLVKIASVYKRPLTSFYCSRPPKTGDRGEDFRTLSREVSKEEAGMLNALLRDMSTRQDMVKSILEDDEDAGPLPFVGSIRVEEKARIAARTILTELGIEDSRSFRSGLNTPSKLFAALRSKVESRGVFVLLAGNLGSHHTNISEGVFRGFAIADEVAPFIVVNEQDAISARSFTLIHEFAHIFIGSSGVSGSPSADASRSRHSRVERFCNDVASEILLPEETLPVSGSFQNVAEASKAIGDVAEEWRVSEAMVAYRFWRKGNVSGKQYQELVEGYAERWRATKARRRRTARDSDSRPSYYTVRRHRLGNSLIGLVGRALRAEELTHTKAARILGVKPSGVEPLLEGIDGMNGSRALSSV